MAGLDASFDSETRREAEERHEKERQRLADEAGRQHAEIMRMGHEEEERRDRAVVEARLEVVEQRIAEEERLKQLETRNENDRLRAEVAAREVAMLELRKERHYKSQEDEMNRLSKIEARLRAQNDQQRAEVVWSKERKLRRNTAVANQMHQRVVLEETRKANSDRNFAVQQRQAAERREKEAMRIQRETAQQLSRSRAELDRTGQLLQLSPPEVRMRATPSPLRSKNRSRRRVKSPQCSREPRDGSTESFVSALDDEFGKVRAKLANMKQGGPSAIAQKRV